MAKNIEISVIVPVYNESKRLHHLRTIADYLKGFKKSTELIVVNDGSTDNTQEKLKELKKTFDFRLISYRTNKGKGHAVKIGMLRAVGNFRLFCDVDLSTPIEEINELSKYLDKYDVVIGTRKITAAKVLVEQSPIRKWLGKGFTLLSQIILNVWISDFTCGFKFFSREAAEKIFSKSLVFRWGFDSEIMFLAKKYGFSIKEVPVTWINDTQTRVKFPRDIFVSLRELLTIRFNDWMKRKY